jgi:hypothetical protein
MVCSSQRARNKVIDIPRAFGSKGSVVTKGQPFVAQMAFSRGAIVDAV